MSNKSSSLYYNQISKKGLLENDKKLLLKKFGFKNFHLSQENFSLSQNSLFSIKNESRKPIKTSALSIINNSQKSSQVKTKNILNNNIHNEYSSNNPSLKKPKSKYNKSMSSLLINPIINMKDKNDDQLFKMRNIISSVNATATTAQNSIKTNIGLLSNTEMIKPIKKARSKSKNNKNSINIKTKNCSTPNLFGKVHNPINLNKEKPNKVYNNSTYLSKVNKRQLAKKY